MDDGAARLLVVAGEASADGHAAAALVELRGLVGPLEARGMGGPALARAGMRLDVDLRATTAMGGLELAGRLPRIGAAFLRLLSLARRFRPRAALLVDLPDFNLPLAAALRRAGVRVLGYVAPQVWAWRPGRARPIARRYDRIACILPFEEAALRRAGGRATFVGHPLVDLPPIGRAEARGALGLEPSTPCLALLPGSRPAERSRLLPPMIEAARRLGSSLSLDVLVAEAPSLPRPRLPDWVTAVRAGQAGGAPGRLALAAADLALVASGTATLEAALAGVPQVAAYRLAGPTNAFARLVVRSRFAALPNVLLGRRAVPELIQGAAVPDVMAHHLLALRPGGAAAREQLEALGPLRALLGPPGAGRRVAGLLAELLE